MGESTPRPASQWLASRLPADGVGALYREVRRRLRAAGIKDDGIEAEALVCAALDVEPARLYTVPESVPDPGGVRLIDAWTARRVNREPLAYIVGNAPFYGRKFAVDRRVLVPRTETEMLVEQALSWPLSDTPGLPVRVADVGTGSGVLAITIAIEISARAGRRGVEVHAVDSSEDALAVARANGETHRVGHVVRFYQGDLSAPLSRRFDIVVANLPYIRCADIERLQPELRFEPRSALDGGDDGMRYVGPMIDALRGLLAPDGLALLEIDPPITSRARARARAVLPDARVSVFKDLARLDRVLQVDRAGGGKG
jgi:release factor glutamine methyltransferase